MFNIDLNRLDYRQNYALYVHIPFCHYRCFYCDFYASAGVSLEVRSLVSSRIKKEIITQLSYLDIKHLDTVYLGGGTPSILPHDDLHSLIDLCQKYAPNQVTIEINPEDVTVGLLRTLALNKWKNIRLSMGIQTFHQASLDAVGRKVTVYQMQRALDLLSDYKNILNLDLIAGLPYHTRYVVQADMQKLLEYRPSHLSLYSLVMEEGTVLTYRGHSFLPNIEERTLQWQIARSLLLKANYIQYEISNYSIHSNYESLQNLHYWHLKPYIGIGPGAVSTLALDDGSALRITGRREFKKWTDFSNQDLWIYEKIPASDFLFEHYMMGLRTIYGVSKTILKQRFGQKGVVPWKKMYHGTWKEFMQENTSHLSLSKDGMLFLDAFLVDLLKTCF